MCLPSFLLAPRVLHNSLGTGLHGWYNHLFGRLEERAWVGFRASPGRKPPISGVREKLRAAWFQGTLRAPSGHAHPSQPPALAWSCGSPRLAVQDAFVCLKSAQVFIVRFREGDSICFRIKGNAVISNLTARSLLLIGLYLLRANLPSPLRNFQRFVRFSAFPLCRGGK